MSKNADNFKRAAANYDDMQPDFAFEKTVKCLDCDGESFIECRECFGAGGDAMECECCEGKGKVKCELCNGTGEVAIDSRAKNRK